MAKKTTNRTEKSKKKVEVLVEVPECSSQGMKRTFFVGEDDVANKKPCPPGCSCDSCLIYK